MTEKRLIDLLRVDLGEVDISDCTDVEDIFSAVITYLFEQPTVDAVEVVRCKECKFYELKYYPDNTKAMTCENSKAIWTRTPPDAFCSYGERRIDNA